MSRPGEDSASVGPEISLGFDALALPALYGQAAVTLGDPVSAALEPSRVTPHGPLPQPLFARAT
jgi:hypothetical protein